MAAMGTVTDATSDSLIPQIIQHVDVDVDVRTDLDPADVPELVYEGCW